MTSDCTPRHRPVRSFVRREGRLTPAQQRALDALLPVYGIEFTPVLLNLDEVFGREAPGKRILEIGFGNGDVLAELASRHPENDYLGIEVHRPGIGHLLRSIERLQLTNIRIIAHDAVEVLRHQLPHDSLDQVLLFFPDPWPKKRHHKRRILQAGFVELVADRLYEGGVFHLATDWENYAEHMLEVLEAAPAFVNEAGAGQCSPRPDTRPLTRFERRGTRLGHEVTDLVYRKIRR